MRIERNGWIFQPEQGVQCHASHLALTEDGGVYAVWFQGSREGADDVCIFGARMSREGVWTSPRRITPDNGLPHWNPVLMRDRNGGFTLYYKEGRVIAYWHTMVMHLSGDAETWSQPRELVPGDVGGRGPVRNKILRLEDGTLAAPASLEDGIWRCFVDLSHDGGETWTPSQEIRLPVPEDGAPTPFGCIQPTLWQDDTGAVHALMRTSQGELYRSDSLDGAKTWCAPYPAGVPNNNSGVDLARTPDGTLYLVCNPVADNWGARSPISVMRSVDNGASWSLFTHLVTMPGEYSYPAVLYHDGALYITHTWQRKTIQFWKICL